MLDPSVMRQLRVALVEAALERVLAEGQSAPRGVREGAPAQVPRGAQPARDQERAIDPP